MGEFSPQPKGPGQIFFTPASKLAGDPEFPISLSLVIPVDQLQFTPRSSISKKSAPRADGQQL